jgi:hypothetical protein
MIQITTTLYYDDDDFWGRALTKDEYDNITADELRDAINHSICRCEIGIDDGDGRDLRPTPEADRVFNAMSAEQLKEALQKHNAVLMRAHEPLDRYVFPVFTKGPRKGETNYKKYPEIFWDRWYRVDFLSAEYGVVARECVVELHDDGTFTFVDKAPA